MRRAESGASSVGVTMTRSKSARSGSSETFRRPAACEDFDQIAPVSVAFSVNGDVGE
jgi:hypothetical protein